jgi:3-hydroxyisobutyrate dehydrogenase-like beta-hydroxyacid dehydrogenase
MNETTVGFVGLGQIGAPMADRLVGWPGGLVLYDARPEAMEPFAATGAKLAGSVAEVGRTASIISVMVRDDAQVTDVVREIAATTAGFREVIVAVHSTIRADTAPALAAEVRSAGVELIDAPVSGGALGARDGRLAVMIGGSRGAYELCREPFGRWAELILHFGPVGAGTRAKLARNLLHFVSFTAAAEAQRLAAAAGLDLRKLGKVVRHSDVVTGGSGAIMLRGTTAPLEASDPLAGILEHVRELGEKDLTLALELGAELGVDLPLAEIALRDFGAGLGLPAVEDNDG